MTRLHYTCRHRRETSPMHRSLSQGTNNLFMKWSGFDGARSYVVMSTGPYPAYKGETNQRRIASSGMLRRVALVRTDVSKELRASFIRVTRIGELVTTLAVISVDC
jgi:hypothetical protein